MGHLEVSLTLDFNIKLLLAFVGKADESALFVRVNRTFSTGLDGQEKD